MRDELHGLIAEREARSPGFAALVDDNLRNRQIIREVAAQRLALGLTQEQVAVQMKTSQAAVNRIERGEADLRLSTVFRYAAACGQRLTFGLQSDPQLVSRVTQRASSRKGQTSRLRAAKRADRS